MNDNNIKSSKNNEIITRKCACMNTDMELNVTCDKGMSFEYFKQLGTGKCWTSSGMRVFKTETDMLAFASYFNQATGSLSNSRPATPAQVKYLVMLGVKIEENMTVERASQLIDWAKRGEDMSAINAVNEDGSI